jgi:hypothetical protein
MIWAFVKAYWKQLLIVAMLAALVIGGVVAWNVHGDRQYDAGYAKAQADQKQADDKARSQRDQEKTQIEREAQSRIDVARVDAEHANSAADGLRSELDKTKRLAENYTGSFPTGTPASKVIRCSPTCLKKAIDLTSEQQKRLSDIGMRESHASDSMNP